MSDGKVTAEQIAKLDLEHTKKVRPGLFEEDWADKKAAELVPNLNGMPSFGADSSHAVRKRIAQALRDARYRGFLFYDTVARSYVGNQIASLREEAFEKEGLSPDTMSPQRRI